MQNKKKIAYRAEQDYGYSLLPSFLPLKSIFQEKMPSLPRLGLSND